MKHAKLLENDQIQFIGSTMKIGNIVIANPTDEQYLSQGWKKYYEVWEPNPSPVSAALSSDANYVPTEYQSYLSGYTQDDSCISAVYAWKEVVQRRTYSKLKMLVKLTSLGKWAEVRSFLEDNQISGTTTTYKELWDAAQNFDSANEYYQTAQDAIQDLLGLTDAELAEMLKDCIAD